MAIRYQGECSIRLRGNEDLARQFISEARTEMGIMIANAAITTDANLIRKRLLPNSIEITCIRTPGPFSNSIIEIYAPGGGVKYYLLYNPVYKYTYGWGYPYLPFNDPLGTSLGPTSITDPFDTRHKAAVGNYEGEFPGAVTNWSINQLYGNQYFGVSREAVPPRSADYPGNAYWTDDTRTLAYWFLSGSGSPIYPATDWFYQQIDDNGTTRYWPWSSTGDTGHPQYVDEINPRGIAIVVNEHSSTGADRVDLTYIADICHTVVLDGVKHQLPNMAIVNNIGVGRTPGNYIMGAGMVGTWIVWVDTDNVDKLDEGEEIVNYRHDYVKAYNTVPDPTTGTHAYRYLGKFNSVLGGSDTTSGVLRNSMKVEFSRSGTKFTTGRMKGQFCAFCLKPLNGIIYLDQNGDPISITTTYDDPTGRSAQSYFYYGYRGIEEIPYGHAFLQYAQTYNRDLYAVNWSIENGFFYGFGVFEGQWYAVVMVNDKVFIYYAFPGTDTINWSTPYSNEFINFDDFANSIDEAYNLSSTWNTTSVHGVGAFLCVPVSMEEYFQNDPNATNDKLNIWVQPDGVVSDMGDVLLNGEYTGNKLVTGPMIQVTSIS